MHEELPRIVRNIVRRLEFIAIPNLGMFIAALAVMAFVAKMAWGTPYERFIFDPVRLLNGEWWRLFSFPLSQGFEHPIWLFFYAMYVYFVMNALELHWGPGPLTVFVGFGYLCAMAGAFITGQPTSLWFFILENVSLAFGTLFPEVEFLLFFILPVKAKWLAMFAGAILLFQFVVGSSLDKLFYAVVLLPYFTFFSPALYRLLRQRARSAQHKKNIDHDMWRR